MAHLLAVAFPIELRRHRWNALQGGQVQQGEVTTAVRQPSADIDVVHVAQHGRLAQRRVADDNGKDVLHEAVSFYDLEIGHVGWYPFASLDQLSTLYEAPAAILGDGVARASVYPAVAASGRQVEVSVAAEAGASSEATTPQIVSYGGEFGQNPYEPGLLPGDSVFSSIILRASTGYGAAVPADIGVNYNFTFMGYSFSFTGRQVARGMWGSAMVGTGLIFPYPSPGSGMGAADD